MSSAPAQDLADAEGISDRFVSRLMRLSYLSPDVLQRLVTQRVPLCANTNALFGNILLYCGRPKEAVDHVKTAIRSAPVYALWWVEILASAYRDGGQNNQAITAINELLSKKPDSTSGLTILISALVADGQLETAKGYAVKLMKLDPEFSISQYATRHPYRDRRQIEPQLANLKAAGLRQ